MREWFVKYKVHLLCGVGVVVYCLFCFFDPIDRYYQLLPIARKIRPGMSMHEIQNMIPQRFNPRIELSDSINPRAYVISDKRKDVYCHLEAYSVCSLLMPMEILMIYFDRENEVVGLYLFREYGGNWGIPSWGDPAGWPNTTVENEGRSGQPPDDD